MKPESELFILHGNSVGISVFDFFKWWSGDMLTNSVRGVLAEYIVAMALGCEEGTRLGAWNDFDLVGPDGIRVEVKSSAYLQNWHQTKLSKIVFSISPSRSYDYDSGRYMDGLERRSDVYVFCVFECTDRRKARLSDLDQWGFYVMSTSEINRRFGNQKTVSIGSLLKAGAQRICYTELRSSVCQAACR